MVIKPHQFNIPLDKLICPTCNNEERDIGLTHKKDPNGKIIGAIITLQCCECYVRAEDVLIVNYIKEEE
jgi:C4-type Zn-finger protein